MFKLLFNRTLESTFSLACLVIAVFFISRLTGDPGKLYLPLTATDEMIENFNRLHGFDQPIWVQFLKYIQDLVRFDFGMSLRLQEPAIELVLQAYPATLLLVGMVALLSIVVGAVLGCLAAIRPRSIFDRLATILSISAASLPDFWVALIGIIVFAITLRWLPTSGTGTWAHAVMPIVVLSLRPIGSLVQVVRGSMLEVLNSTYMEAARGRGVPLRRLLFQHALRNAALPALTMIGVSLTHTLNGAVVVETIFGWPGIGKLIIDVILNRDFAVLQAAVVVVAIAIFLLNLIIDILYGVIDPRVQ